MSTVNRQHAGSVQAAAPKKAKSMAGELLGILNTLARVLVGYAVLAALVAMLEFPTQVDTVTRREIPKASTDYYARIYAAQAQNPDEVASPDDYVDMAQEAIAARNMKEVIAQFVRIYGLEDAKVLDVGAGTGYLQDEVENYVGLDISSTAARYYHKPFIEASATEMPVPDNEFDAAWTVFVLEHVPQPEQALLEMRRVVKDGGLLFVAPAWDCRPWFAEGYPVRAFSELDVKGKVMKAGIPLLEFPPFRILTRGIKRVALRASHLTDGGPASLRYRLLEPNYDKYWMPDSDALNDLDRDETLTWFTSRGDECMNCDERSTLIDMAPLIIRVHKSADKEAL